MHVFVSDYNGSYRFLPCNAITPLSKLHLDFIASSTIISPQNVQCETAHRACWGYQKLDASFLLTCRQMYHEARYVLWSSTIWSFDRADSLQSFMHDIQNSDPLNIGIIKKLHLHIGIQYKDDESNWNEALREVAEKLTGLKRLHVTVNLLYECGIANGCDDRFPHSSDPNMTTRGKGILLGGLYALKTLPLETLTIAVCSSRSDHGYFGWKQEDRQVWARYVTDSILRK